MTSSRVTRAYAVTAIMASGVISSFGRSAGKAKVKLSTLAAVLVLSHSLVDAHCHGERVDAALLPPRHGRSPARAAFATSTLCSSGCSRGWHSDG